MRLVEDQRQPKRKPTTTTTEIQNILLEPEQNSWKLTAPSPTPATSHLPWDFHTQGYQLNYQNVLTIIEAWHMHVWCDVGERENIEREGEREEEREMRKRPWWKLKANMETRFLLGLLFFSLSLSLSLSLISFVCVSFVFSKPKPMSIFSSSILPCVLGMA